MTQTARYREEGHHAVLDEPRGMGMPQIVNSWRLRHTVGAGGIHGRHPMVLPEWFVSDSVVRVTMLATNIGYA